MQSHSVAPLRAALREPKTEPDQAAATRPALAAQGWTRRKRDARGPVQQAQILPKKPGQPSRYGFAAPAAAPGHALPGHTPQA
ncbi:hypothetical protein N5F13_04305 [Comamonas thiooxydans]|uniref:hypothetical protein n=1 Tax=Comamonas thiooxydans TaxID=363952 RepID=UPI0015CD860A|nr:hypothetical protein [Comamonas thiooxydans]MDH1473707.1 hypothetical protein [Comamonas thiooxydans]